MEKQSKKIPTRMCCVCRERQPKQNLIRVVKNNQNEIFIDKTFKADGRGAYVCKNVKCLENLQKNKGLNRSFKCEVPLNIYTEIKGEINKLD